MAKIHDVLPMEADEYYLCLAVDSKSYRIRAGKLLVEIG